MMRSSSSPLRRLGGVLAAAGLLAATVCSGVSQGQTVRRLFRMPSSSDPSVMLPGTVPSHVRNAVRMGHLPGETEIDGMALVLKPSDAQQAELTQLLADQQNPSSAQYRKWLTPESFGERFGLADADLEIAKEWLVSRGFTVNSVAPSRNRIVFSGTASAVENAFSTSVERFHRSDEDFFANSTEIRLPQGLAAVVSSVTGISNYRLLPPPHPQVAVSPNFTTGGGGRELVPWDFRQIFGVNTLISQGFDGTGVSIGVIGQSEVDLNQLALFQGKTGQATRPPTEVLVPNSGVANHISGDEGESELDLEYAGGTAPGAKVLFVYTGCGTTVSSTPLTDAGACRNGGVITALTYAITQNLAPILTLSYGGCESDDASEATSLEQYLAQAGTQGQTVMVATGDTGAASCESAGKPTLATGGISVEYPSSSPNVTAVGGTQINGNSSAYWQGTNNSFGGSAIGYIPEVAWNDTAQYGSFSASTGGSSELFGKPSWQIGTGVPADGHRDVPDVSFPSALFEAPYLICAADAPCTAGAGFGRNSGGGGLVGGTSAATPNFAAMLAVIEQANGGGALGNINPNLYKLAIGSTVGSIFHDITSGNNIVPCQGGTTGCSSTNPSVNGTMGYTAGVGYDLVTGLGSMDAAGLAVGLKSLTSSTKLTPTVALSAATNTPVGGATDLLSLTVSGTGAAPTGTVVVSIDGATATTLTLSNGAATYTYTVPACTVTNASTCPHSITASYSGDAIYNVATATISLTVASTATVTSGSISLKPAQSSVTVTSGGTATNTFPVTSTGGFAGTVSFKVAVNNTLSACYDMEPVTVPSNGTATATISVYTTSGGPCATAGAQSFRPAIAANHPPSAPDSRLPRSGLAVMAAGVMGAFLLRRRMRPAALLMVVASIAVFGLAGCGGNSGPSIVAPPGSQAGNAAPGTYVLTVTATGVPSNGAASVAATSSFTLVVQ